MDIRRVVGENVRRLRIAAGLSQEDLAARIGVGQGYISGLEAGRRNPTIVTIWHVAIALGIKPHRLLKTSGPKTSKKQRRKRAADSMEKVR
jgi:transcriptional regulator with XRE-family HTH domain